MAKHGEPVDFVIGVDTHKHSHTASVVDALGTPLGTFELPADAQGYSQMLDLAEGHAPGIRVWAVEGAGGYGSGLAAHLAERGEQVVEIDRPKRPARRNGAKTDALDATPRGTRASRPREPRRAARTRRARSRPGDPAHARMRGAGPHPGGQPSAGAGDHRPRRVSARSSADSGPRRSPDAARSCGRRRPSATRSAARWSRSARSRAVSAISTRRSRSSTRSSSPGSGRSPRRFSTRPASDRSTRPRCCAPGRTRGGCAPKPRSPRSPAPRRSPRRRARRCATRLDRCGDRRLNRALHIAVLIRCVRHAETRRYAERRRAQGKTDREIRRCLKRFLARRVFKILEAGRPLASEA